MAKADGFTKPGFEKVLEVFKSNVEKGIEKGGSFAAYYKGELVVHLWGGVRDVEGEKPWQRDTMSAFFSTTKGMTAICIAHLVDKGLLDYTEKVSTYWPEFAQNGKENVTLRQYLTHTAGLMNLDGEWQSREIIDDWDNLEKKMAAQKPYWEPGTACGYHAMTFALYLDALIRRVDPKKRTLSQYFQEEIAKPFGVEFYIGLPESLEGRMAKLVNYKDEEVDMEKFYAEFMERLPQPEYFQKSNEHHSPTDLKEILDINLPGRHQIPDGSAYGFGTADAVAKVFGILANGGVHEGKTLLKGETIQGLQTPFFTDVDHFVGELAVRGHGTWIFHTLDNNDYKNSHYSFGHPGAGGQFGYGDSEYKVGWSYLSNFMDVDMSSIDTMAPRTETLLNALYECIKAIEKKPGPWKLYFSTSKFNKDQEASEAEKK